MNTLILSVLFMTAANQYRLPTGLLQSVCFVETKHNVNVIHYHDGKTNSYGVCQIKIESARQMGFKGTAKELMRPENNITYAALYLNHQLHRYHGSASKAVIAYNRGHAGRLTTSSYQRKVFSVWRKAYLKRNICQK